MIQAFSATILALLQPPAGQAAPVPVPAAGQAATTADSQPDDVIVRGWRERTKLPTSVDAPPAVSGPQTRRKYEVAERMARCAARSRLSRPALLRAVIDGEFNSATHAVAQDRLKRTYITCGEGWYATTFTTADPPPMTMTGGMASPSSTTEGAISGAPVSTDPAPLGHSIYDRGAFMIETIRHYAPDLHLTRAETESAAVQRRFDLRELPRNRYRLPLDKKYLQVTVCMVRMQPELAVQLVMNDQKGLLDDLQAAIINRSRPCVSNAKRVQVDATQFRIYIADAVYRWAVAARNVGSLIPAG